MTDELKVAIQARIDAKKQEQQDADNAIALSPAMLDKEATDAIVQENVSNLDAIIRGVNKIDPIQTNNGDRYTVNCFSVATNVFGEVVGRLLGLVNITSAMFTEDRQTKFEAITSVPYITWANTAKAFGKPAYFSKGNLVPAVPADVEELKVRIQALCLKLGLPTSDADVITEATVDAHFINKANSASKAQLAHEKAQTLLADGDDDYQIND